MLGGEFAGGEVAAVVRLGAFEPPRGDRERPLSGAPVPEDEQAARLRDRVADRVGVERHPLAVLGARPQQLGPTTAALTMRHESTASRPRYPGRATLRRQTASRRSASLPCPSLD